MNSPITPRELFAAAALTGLLARPEAGHALMVAGRVGLVNAAWEWADLMVETSVQPETQKEGA